MNSDFQAFLESRKHQSAVTQDIYRAWLVRFESYLLSHALNWRRCQAADVDGYHQKLLWTHNSAGRLYSPNTVTQALQVIRHFYRWACNHRLVSSDPTTAWVFRKPPQINQLVLSHEQILKLFNLPDLAKPTGLRDLLLLELVYSCSLSLETCRLLKTEWQDHFEAVKPIWERYLEHGRPLLLRDSTDTLLLANRAGRAYQSAQSLALIIKEYGHRLGLNVRLHARVLHRSAAAHQSTLAQRFQISKNSGRLIR